MQFTYIIIIISIASELCKSARGHTVPQIKYITSDTCIYIYMEHAQVHLLSHIGLHACKCIRLAMQCARMQKDVLQNVVQIDTINYISIECRV